jgi:hypothetical protein
MLDIDFEDFDCDIEFDEFYYEMDYFGKEEDPFEGGNEEEIIQQVFNDVVTTPKTKRRRLSFESPPPILFGPLFKENILKIACLLSWKDYTSLICSSRSLLKLLDTKSNWIKFLQRDYPNHYLHQEGGNIKYLCSILNEFSEVFTRANIPTCYLTGSLSSVFSDFFILFWDLEDWKRLPPTCISLSNAISRYLDRPLTKEEVQKISEVWDYVGPYYSTERNDVFVGQCCNYLSGCKEFQAELTIYFRKLVKYGKERKGKKCDEKLWSKIWFYLLDFGVRHKYSVDYAFFWKPNLNSLTLALRKAIFGKKVPKSFVI